MATGQLCFSPLLHLLRNLWRNCAKTLCMNSSQCLDVSARKRFWSVNKYGGTAAIFKITLLNTVTISLSYLLQDHLSDFFKLAWDVPLVVWLCTPENGSFVHWQIWPPAAIFDFHHYSISSKTTGAILSKPCIWIPLNAKICPPENNSGPATNMAEWQPSLKSLIAHYSTL